MYFVDEKLMNNVWRYICWNSIITNKQTQQINIKNWILKIFINEQQNSYKWRDEKQNIHFIYMGFNLHMALTVRELLNWKLILFMYVKIKMLLFLPTHNFILFLIVYTKVKPEKWYKYSTTGY